MQVLGAETAELSCVLKIYSVREMIVYNKNLVQESMSEMH